MIVKVECFGGAILFSVAICTLIQCVSCNWCTDVLKRNHIEEVVVKVPCTEKYTARCGWLSLNYCTFYRSTFCDKKMNDTITTYYIVTECCRGFFKANNGTCLKKIEGVDYSHLKSTNRPNPNNTATGIPDYKEPPKKSPVRKENKAELSGGGVAGIVCGFIFIVCIVAFTINGIRKRRRATQKDKKQVTTQPVMYMGQVTGSAEPVVSVASCMPPPNTAQAVARETTPCDLSHTAETKETVVPLVQNSRETSEVATGATPLLSGKTALPDVGQTSGDAGVTPLMSVGQTVDDIPESDV